MSREGMGGGEAGVNLHSRKVAKDVLELLQIRLTVNHSFLLLVDASQAPTRVIHMFACAQQRLLKRGAITRELQELSFGCRAAHILVTKGQHLPSELVCEDADGGF